MATDFQHRQRVRFAEPFDGMPNEIDQLVGDTGFVVRPIQKLMFDGKVLVQFDENKTGRPGGERHWIPASALRQPTETCDACGRESEETFLDGHNVGDPIACRACHSDREADG